MAGVAKFHRVELVTSSEDFRRLVQKISDHDELSWFDLTPGSLLGDIDPSQLALLVQACEQNSDLHVVSYCRDLRTLNRLVPHAAFYYLARGDKNPYLVFNPWVDPKSPLIDGDVFGKLGGEAHKIYRRPKR